MREEDFSDTLHRYFPDEFEHVQYTSEFKMASKTVTFQVTDDCNMACSYCY